MSDHGIVGRAVKTSGKACEADLTLKVAFTALTSKNFRRDGVAQEVCAAVWMPHPFGVRLVGQPPSGLLMVAIHATSFAVTRALHQRKRLKEINRLTGITLNVRSPT
jgi:hypothetical protein